MSGLSPRWPGGSSGAVEWKEGSFGITETLWQILVSPLGKSTSLYSTFLLRSVDGESHFLDVVRIELSMSLAVANAQYMAAAYRDTEACQCLRFTGESTEAPGGMSR